MISIKQNRKNEMSKKKKIAIAWLCFVLIVLLIGAIMGNPACTGILAAFALFAATALTLSAIYELMCDSIP